MSLPTVSVRGQASFEVEPELASISITVTAQHADRESAATLLGDRIQQANSLAERFAHALESVSNRGVQLYPQLKDGRLDAAAQYAGRCAFDLRVTDFAVLSDLLIAAAEIELTEIAGPWWQLRPDSPAYRQARLLAISDARARARDYAAAFGSDIVGLLEVSDVGMTGTAAPRVSAASAPAKASGQAVFDLEPARQTVTGAIEARFSITAPDLTGRP